MLDRRADVLPLLKTQKKHVDTDLVTGVVRVANSKELISSYISSYLSFEEVTRLKNNKPFFERSNPILYNLGEGAHWVVEEELRVRTAQLLRLVGAPPGKEGAKYTIESLYNLYCKYFEKLTSLFNELADTPVKESSDYQKLKEVISILYFGFYTTRFIDGAYYFSGTYRDILAQCYHVSDLANFYISHHDTVWSLSILREFGLSRFVSGFTGLVDIISRPELATHFTVMREHLTKDAIERHVELANPLNTFLQLILRLKRFPHLRQQSIEDALFFGEEPERIIYFSVFYLDKLKNKSQFDPSGVREHPFYKLTKAELDELTQELQVINDRFFDRIYQKFLDPKCQFSTEITKEYISKEFAEKRKREDLITRIGKIKTLEELRVFYVNYFGKVYLNFPRNSHRYTKEKIAFIEACQKHGLSLLLKLNKPESQIEYLQGLEWMWVEFMKGHELDEKDQTLNEKHGVSNAWRLTLEEEGFQTQFAVKGQGKHPDEKIDILLGAYSLLRNDAQGKDIDVTLKTIKQSVINILRKSILAQDQLALPVAMATPVGVREDKVVQPIQAIIPSVEVQSRISDSKEELLGKDILYVGSAPPIREDVPKVLAHHMKIEEDDIEPGMPKVSSKLVSKMKILETAERIVNEEVEDQPGLPRVLSNFSLLSSYSSSSSRQDEMRFGRS